MALFDRDHPEIAPVSERVDLAILDVEKGIGPLIEAIEAKAPGNPLGKLKDEHMRKMAADAASTATLIGWDGSDSRTQLLRFIFRTHDLGRLTEQVHGLDTLRSGQRHGYLSADFLSPTLDRFFTPAESNVIRFAVIYHAENVEAFDEAADEFQGDGKETALEICYMLRDMDSMERLQDTDKFLSPEGITKQIERHYNKNKENRLTDEQVRLIMFGGLSDTAKTRFKEHQTLPIAEVAFSYSNYMVLQLAIIFETRSPALIEEIYSQRETYLSPRIRFLKSHLPSEDYHLVLESIATFFADKLAYDNVGSVEQIVQKLDSTQ